MTPIYHPVVYFTAKPEFIIRDFTMDCKSYEMHSLSIQLKHMAELLLVIKYL